MGQLISKNSPLAYRIVAYLVLIVLAGSGILVLPLLILLNSGINLKAVGILLNKDGYSRQIYHITEYMHQQGDLIVRSGSEKYFTGTVKGLREYMEDLTFASYSPELNEVMDNSPVGRTELDLAIDIWYNPEIKDTWPADGHFILPYSDEIFISLGERLKAYAVLWFLLAIVWSVMYFLPKIVKAREAKNHQYN